MATLPTVSSAPMETSLLAKVLTPYVRKDCGFTPPHPVFLCIEKDGKGVYCRLATFSPYYILARLYVENSFSESAKKYVNVPLVNGRCQNLSGTQKARAHDVHQLIPYESFINSCLESRTAS